MNSDRRVTARVIIELLKECSMIGEMQQASYDMIREALESMRVAEYYQHKRQLKYAGKNESTDTQIRICEVALPALERAEKALEQDDFDKVITLLEKAINADGTKPTRRKVGRTK